MRQTVHGEVPKMPQGAAPFFSGVWIRQIHNIWSNPESVKRPPDHSRPLLTGWPGPNRRCGHTMAIQPLSSSMSAALWPTRKRTSWSTAYTGKAARDAPSDAPCTRLNTKPTRQSSACPNGLRALRTRSLRVCPWQRHAVSRCTSFLPYRSGSQNGIACTMSFAHTS